MHQSQLLRLVGVDASPRRVAPFGLGGLEAVGLGAGLDECAVALLHPAETGSATAP